MKKEHQQTKETKLKKIAEENKEK